MKRTPEVEQVLRVVRRVISRRFANDQWVLVGDPLMQEIDAAVEAEPGQTKAPDSMR